MKSPITIPEISQGLIEASEQLVNYCSSLRDEQFFYQPPGKWSAAQQVKHLVQATRMSKLAYTLPKFIVRMAGGKPNRVSRTYDELVAKYKLKLAQGGKAGPAYTPAPLSHAYGMKKLIEEYQKQMLALEKALRKNFREEQTDHYIIPHPLLGRITLRELGFFTIYHTYHHLDSIRERTAN